MTTLHLCAALLLAAAVPLAAATAAAALKAGHWRLHADRHRIELTPRLRRTCPDCRGAGGWWVGGADPDMEACRCWANSPPLRLRLLPVPAWPDGSPL
ncbi:MULTISPECIES: hypothetical protein [unclassified Streptomyces]|uniref:hypothetical protein n=1 Tax=unclassified Streptomyces TaxID=2593676 RepID=UPI000BAC9470|nr:hypothetical protein [Streptomyces sp. CLI2509]ASY37069.1 hypothetical protein CAC01_31030 [Streptomyces sp. CLI2509]MYX22175.1 hypothetical protein [Streptomyces sp. SID8380]